jgi:DNA mismatch endonuclease (patch repair protein)
VVALFRSRKIVGWRRHRTLLRPGGGLRYIRPDFVFPKERVIVLVDGCFWHGCPTCFKAPKTNQHYWGPKIAANRLRDRTATRVLRQAGWKVVRIWEHDLSCASRALRRIEAALGL